MITANNDEYPGLQLAYGATTEHCETFRPPCFGWLTVKSRKLGGQQMWTSPALTQHSLRRGEAEREVQDFVCGIPWDQSQVVEICCN